MLTFDCYVNVGKLFFGSNALSAFSCCCEETTEAIGMSVIVLIRYRRDYGTYYPGFLMPSNLNAFSYAGGSLIGTFYLTTLAIP